MSGAHDCMNCMWVNSVNRYCFWHRRVIPENLIKANCWFHWTHSIDDTRSYQEITRKYAEYAPYAGNYGHSTLVKRD